MGVHCVPKIKSLIPISLIAGIPLPKRKPHISRIASTEIRAVKVNIPFATFSYPNLIDKTTDFRGDGGKSFATFSFSNFIDRISFI